ncbi:hypothetical protein GALMADRAFT_68887 [Galerina marginata CBS 339.88]|uniref:Microbial-type PARG catalytic domain-containing protein n=1 Tax=Galerina marginata (strain CBS 339.88) TaxID=685588 RepID=A0A067T6F0_GALM3|nr:hypothetical protein GALMADRAFT_68887 [Galerina marginata CBS 339.88]
MQAEPRTVASSTEVEVSASKKSARPSLREIAASTLQAIEDGSFELDGVTYDLRDTIIDAMNQNTSLYDANSDLSEWSDNAPRVDNTEALSEVEITVSECSTLVGARTLKEALISNEVEDERVGVLNFASAKNPGGGFIKGAQAQEESIARSSTIYSSLMSDVAQPFFRSHKKDPKQGYYSHAMLYIPRVLFFRSDKGDWLPPIEADIVSSAAINAGVVRRYLRENKSTDESNLDAAMKERMARILYLFEWRGVRNLVLGSFGTGVFRNRVELVAGIWKELLVSPDARFKHSFDRVVFAILGNATFKVFENTFSPTAKEEPVQEGE